MANSVNDDEKILLFENLKKMEKSTLPPILFYDEEYLGV